MPDLILLKESFRRNALANQGLLERITRADLEIPTMAGNWNIGQVLAHMLYGRTGWLLRLSPPHAAVIPAIAEGEWNPGRLIVATLADISAAFRIADEAALAAVHDNPSFQPVFQSNPAHFLQLLMVHDATHRGHILSALRIAGRGPDAMQVLEDAAWDPWFE